MRKKFFSIEWPDEYGDDWINKRYIFRCMVSDCHVNIPIKVEDAVLSPEKENDAKETL